MEESQTCFIKTIIRMIIQGKIYDATVLAQFL